MTERLEVPVVRPVQLMERERATLEGQFERLLMRPAADAGLPLKRVDQVWPAPTQPVMYQGTDGSSWLVSDYASDPAALELGGRIAAPREQVERLHTLGRAGVECDLVCVAHELPSSWKPGQTLIPDPPRTRRQRQLLEAFAQRVGEASRATAQVTLAAAETTARLAGAVAVGTAVIAVGTVAAGAALAAPGAEVLLSLDPIILGGVEVGNNVMWAELARWDWA